MPFRKDRIRGRIRLIINHLLIFKFSLFPNNIAGAFSGMFYAFEKFEYPTAIEIATALVSVALQIAVLLAGPLLGHASWHAYREAVQGAAEPDPAAAPAD